MSSGLPNYTPWQPTLPYGTLQECQERQALCYFFSQFTAIPQHHSTSRGYLEYLLPAYFDAAPQSPLFAALSATALATFSNRPGRKVLMYNAQKMYLTAVALIQKAVADPVEAKMDTTIVAVLLLGLYETITCTEHSLPSWGKHVDGAVALVKHRGDDLFKSSLGARIFYWVRAQMVVNQITRCQPVQKLEGMAKGWTGPINRLEGGAMNLLVILAMQIPTLRATAKEILRQPMSMNTAAEIVELMSEARRVDREIAAWTFKIPDDWKYTIVGMIEGMDNPATDQYYPGPMHSYLDLWSANIWNNYRSYRIFCQMIILNCLERLIPSWERTSTSAYCSTLAILQALVNDICSSVPYHLGFPDYVYQSNESAPNHDYILAMDDIGIPHHKPDPCPRSNNVVSMGGFFLTWQLFVAFNVVAIPEAQRIWLNSRLRYIGDAVGINQATVVADRGLRSLAMGRSLDRARGPSVCDFAPPSDPEWERTGGSVWRQLIRKAGYSDEFDDGDDGLYD
ncbi:hypothetical protein MMC26_006580 [Xylographa opegraphella]|nr:hypothetical protein [Xylographa opegraphella]